MNDGGVQPDGYEGAEEPYEDDEGEYEDDAKYERAEEPYVSGFDQGQMASHCPYAPKSL